MTSGSYTVRLHGRRMNFTVEAFANKLDVVLGLLRLYSLAVGPGSEFVEW